MTTVKEYIAFLNSDDGRAKLRRAAELLRDPSPELTDFYLLEQVIAIGFPKWAALRVFWHCTLRFAPLICEGCQKQFTPRAKSTMDRPICKPCLIAKRGPDAMKKHRARYLATRAEITGRIKKRNCEHCGFHSDLHKHHPDYNRPLYVIWLCARCHAKEHRVSRLTHHASG